MWSSSGAWGTDVPSCGAIDIYDNGNGSILVAWPPFPGIIPDSFNVYVNGVLNQNVNNPPVIPQFLLAESGLQIATEAGQSLLLEQLARSALGGIATITGLLGSSYNASATPPAGNGSARPESLPPIGQITDAQTYDIKVVAVVGGVEVAASLDRTVTVQPQSTMLTTPMRRGPFPFPSTPMGF
jgi:hypothetical protein